MSGEEVRAPRLEVENKGVLGRVHRSDAGCDRIYRGAITE